MAVTVADIINSAFIELGSIVVGESITTAEQTDAFTRLNQMWSSWGTERDSVFTEGHTTVLPIAGQTTYTVGPTGSMVITPKPERLTSWLANYSGFRSGGQVVSIDEFNAQVKDGQGITSNIPSLIGADTDYPNINMRIWPPPSSTPAIVELTYWTAMDQFTSVNQTLILPSGYEEALHTNLAVALYPLYGRQSGIDPVLAQRAQNAKASLVTLHRGSAPQVAA